MCQYSLNFNKRKLKNSPRKLKKIECWLCRCEYRIYKNGTSIKYGLSKPYFLLFIGPDGRIVRRSIFDGQNGTYRVIWKPSVVGEHFIHITVKDIHIQNSPFRVIFKFLKMIHSRDLFSISHQRFKLSTYILHKSQKSLVTIVA